MAEQVEADHAVAAQRERLGHRCLHPAREQQPVQEHDDPGALAVLVVDEPVARVRQLAGAWR